MTLHHLNPQQIARDIFLVRAYFQGPGDPVGVACNSMIIRGAEPVLVDTGAAVGRAEWAAATFSLVDPADVRWIVLTHDDVDHEGNVEYALEQCPNATLVTTWLASQRMAAGMALPLDRQRWVGDGERLAVGDRDLVLVRPPVYDSPVTRGVFDTATGVYWGSDAFGSPVPAPVDHAADLDRTQWLEGIAGFSSMLSPWHTMADRHRFEAEVGRVRALDPVAIASCHGPLIGQSLVIPALDATAALAGAPAVQTPGQELLDLMLSALSPVPGHAA